MLLKVDFECLYPGNNTSSNYIYHNNLTLHISVADIKLRILFFSYPIVKSHFRSFRGKIEIVSSKSFNGMA